VQASVSIIIERPIAAVFAFAANVENMDKWVVGVTEPRRTSDGQFGVGSTFFSKYTYAGKTHDINYVVTAYDPPRRQAVKSTSGPFPFVGTIELEAAGSGTKITNTIDAGSDSAATSAIFFLCGPLLRRMMRKQLRKELEELKKNVESV